MSNKRKPYEAPRLIKREQLAEVVAVKPTNI